MFSYDISYIAGICIPMRFKVLARGERISIASCIADININLQLKA